MWRISFILCFKIPITLISPDSPLHLIFKPLSCGVSSLPTLLFRRHQTQTHHTLHKTSLFANDETTLLLLRCQTHCHRHPLPLHNTQNPCPRLRRHHRLHVSLHHCLRHRSLATHTTHRILQTWPNPNHTHRFKHQFHLHLRRPELLQWPLFRRLQSTLLGLQLRNQMPLLQWHHSNRKPLSRWEPSLSYFQWHR